MKKKGTSNYVCVACKGDVKKEKAIFGQLKGFSCYCCKKQTFVEKRSK